MHNCLTLCLYRLRCSMICFYGFEQSMLCFSGVVFRSTIFCSYVELRSVSCVLYGILDTRNLNLSLQDLLDPLKLIIESAINRSTCTYTLTMCMVHRHIHSLTLTHKTPCKNLLKGRNPCGVCPYLLQGCVNLSN